MKFVNAFKVFAAAALAMLWVMPASAQHYADGSMSAEDSVRQRVYKEMEGEFGRMTVEFWQPRLNAYKVRIDGILSGNDATRLNEMRVQFAIFIERMRAEEEKRKTSYREYEETAAAAPASYDSAVTVAPTPAEDEPLRDGEAPAMMAPDTNGDEVAPTTPPEGSVDDEAQLQAQMQQQMEMQKQRDAEKEARLDSMEALLASGETMDALDDEYGYGGYMGFMELPIGAKWLAKSYRSQLDNLVDVAMDDLNRFTDSLGRFKQYFIATHPDEIARFPELKERIDSYMEMGELEPMLKRPHYFRQMYTTRLEPFVMLYNGDGLGKLFGMVAGSHEAAVAEIPELSMLQQNQPNPASVSTTVAYALPGASSATTLRITNARGEVVAEMDEGAAGAGEHQVQVDVSKLPSGWYVYQLTVQLAKGQQISSKVMHVTH